MDEQKTLHRKFAIVDMRLDGRWYWYVSFRLMPGNVRYEADGIEETERAAHERVMLIKGVTDGSEAEAD